MALSSLSNNLNQTLASGERVLSLLEETPLVEDIPEKEAAGEEQRKEENKSSGKEFQGAEARNVTFAYQGNTLGEISEKGGNRKAGYTEETILDHYSLKLQPGQITGIHVPAAPENQPC